MKKALHLLVTSCAEGALILVVAAIGWATRMPLIFASLGPTAYELVEKPSSPSARTYNIVAGHLLALGSGFLSLWLLNAWNAPKVASAGFVSAPRLWAAVVAVAITTAVTLIAKASQPASLSTALIVTLGSMQTRRDAVSIVIAVLILAAVGEPFRRQFAKTRVKTSS
jgi:hypothetical protein